MPKANEQVFIVFSGETLIAVMLSPSGVQEAARAFEERAPGRHVEFKKMTLNEINLPDGSTETYVDPDTKRKRARKSSAKKEAAPENARKSKIVWKN